MRLAVVGGRLQGTEAAYLAREAGYEVVLVDRVVDAPAAGLAHEVHIFDVREDESLTRRVLATCEAVLPACENQSTLAWLADRLSRWGIPFVFDPPSYALTCSKLRSNRLFAYLEVPRPLPWPDCGFPVVVKPSGASGSEGVRLAETDEALEMALGELAVGGHEAVVQEYVDGPSLSLEVISLGGSVVTFLPTELEFDAGYDCKRVLAPAHGDQALLGVLDQAARRLAEGMGLVGIMDIEAMVRDGEIKIIEIDARLPSQTPTAVYHCCGINLVALLIEAWLGGELPSITVLPQQAVVYEHVRARRGSLEVTGEHALASARPLALTRAFFGADIALTDFDPRASDWVATLIVCRPSLNGARRAADAVVQSMADDLDLTLHADVGPGSRLLYA